MIVEGVPRINHCSTSSRVTAIIGDMLAIVVSRNEEPRWRKTYATTQVSIGHLADNHLVLASDSADARHARVVAFDRKVMVLDLKSASGTFVGGKRLTSPLVIGPHDQIAIGAYTLNAFLVDPEPIAAVRIRSPVERELLDAIVAGDDASRLVYADWLEGADDSARAELLRLQHALDAMSPDAPGFEGATDRLRELAAGVDLAWRSRIAKRPIEGCPAFDFSCPKQWSALTPTERDGVRHCSSCQQHVYYCASVEDAREHAARGACVALDVTSARWTDDLEGPFQEIVCERCRIDVGPGFDRCPRCAGTLPRPAMTVGQIVR
jgi:uncharacterized protein (TIGR02996 family)